MTSQETTGGHEDIILSPEKRERLIVLESRLKILEEASENIKVDPDADISGIVNISKEIIKETLKRYNDVLAERDRKKSHLTRLIERISRTQEKSTGAKALEFIIKIDEEFFNQTETHNTKDGEFATMLRGLVPYLIKLTKKDMLIVFHSK